MVQCAVPFCKNRSDNRKYAKNVDIKQNKRRVSFHCFPKDPVTRNLWLHYLNIDASLLSVRARICSDHFEEGYFKKPTVRARLKHNALPKCIQQQYDASSPLNTTMIRTETDLSDNTSITEEEEKEEENKEDEEETDLSDNGSITEEEEKEEADKEDEGEKEEEEEEDLPIDPSIENCDTIDYYQYKITNAIHLPMLTKKTTKMNTLINMNDSTAQPSTSTENGAIILPHNEISPEVLKLKQKIALIRKRYRQKIRNLQQNLRRKTKQLAKYKCALNEAKTKN